MGAQGGLYGVFCAGAAAVLRCADVGAVGKQIVVYYLFLRYCVYVWRRIFGDAGLSERPVRHISGWGDTRAHPAGVVGGGGGGACVGELYPSGADKQRHPRCAGIQHHDVHHGGAAGGRACVQLAGEAGFTQIL